MKGSTVKLNVTVETIRDLVEVAGVPMNEIAVHMNLSGTMTSLKFKGHRSIFMDEVDAIAAALNSGGRVRVTSDDVVALIGKKNLKVRGFAS